MNYYTGTAYRAFVTQHRTGTGGYQPRPVNIQYWGCYKPALMTLAPLTDADPQPPTAQLGSMPDQAQLPPLPVFTAAAPPSNQDVLAAAASLAHSTHTHPNPTPTAAIFNLTQAGPFNPAAPLSPKVVKRVLALEFVEMSELRADVWVEDLPLTEGIHPTRRPPSKPPVTDIKIWLECFSHMAALLTARFPEKTPEFWAYQSTILRAAHNYEGGSQYRRAMLARRDLNWSTTNTSLYNEAFTGRAKAIPRCVHCLSDDHSEASRPHNPHPPPPRLGLIPSAAPPHVVPAAATKPAHKPTTSFAVGRYCYPRSEICRNFNDSHTAGTSMSAKGVQALIQLPSAPRDLLQRVRTRRAALGVQLGATRRQGGRR